MPQDGYWQRVREICDRHDVLLIADEVICSWGRLGHCFGVDRFGVVPGHDHDGEGAHLGVRADGRRDCVRSRRGAVHARHGMFTHGITFGGHPVVGGRCDGEPRHLRARGPVRPRAREGAGARGGCSRSSRRTCRSSATSAARATSTRSSSVKDKETKESFSDVESEELLRGFMSGELYRAGADLPGGRSRRPGDPAVPAADRRHRGVRDDRHGAALCAHRGLGADRPPLMLTVRGLVAEMGLRDPRPAAWGRCASSVSAHLGADRPDAVAVRR